MRGPKDPFLENDTPLLPVANMPDPFTYVEDALGEGGWLSEYFPGYKPREGQQSLARAVAQSLLERTHLVAEGPTGVGKSFAYAIPAAYHAAALGKRVLVVTANIALQEQLVQKDLPTLQSVLPWPFTFSLLKGRNNYVCLDRTEKTRLHLVTGALRFLSPEELASVEEVKKWTNTTKTGDLSELTVQPSKDVWDRFSVSSDDCLGSACSYSTECYSQEARRQAGRSHIIVTNYHMLFACANSVSVLPEYDVVILDEAHHMVDIAREFFGSHLSEASVRSLVKRLPREYVSLRGGAAPLRRRTEEAAKEFFEQALLFFQSDSYDVRLRDAPPLPIQPLYDALKEGIDYFTKAMEAGTAADQQECANALKHFTKAAQLLEMAMEPQEFEKYVVYFEENEEKEGVTLRSQKFDIAADLQEFLFEKTPTVMVSATLSVDGGFDHLLREVGLPSTTPTLQVESPFSWEDQVHLIVPERFPSPHEAVFRPTVSLVFAEVVKMARGRTLGLFTSWESLKAAHEYLKKENLPYRILCQGEAPRSYLVEEFLKDKDSVLLGVNSMWQGIDVPGESLSCVVIEKLPFPHKNDPVMDALSEQGDAFYEYAVPRAIIAFKQGFGRLIRTTTDRGVVVVLDRRIRTKWSMYGRLFLNSLPNVPLSASIDEVETLLS